MKFNKLFTLLLCATALYTYGNAPRSGEVKPYQGRPTIHVNGTPMTPDVYTPFFHLSSPDLLFGFDADPAIRSWPGWPGNTPILPGRHRHEEVRQEIIKTLGGKKVHPWYSIPGGVNRSLRAEEKDGMIAALPKLKDDLRKALDLVKNYLAENAELAARFATLETSYLGLVKDGNLSFTTGASVLRAPGDGSPTSSTTASTAPTSVQLTIKAKDKGKI